MRDQTRLDFEALESWLQARLGRSIDVQIVAGRSTVGFVRGPIDQVMRFRDDDSHGLIVDGGAGEWSLELAFDDFAYACLLPVPDSYTSHQLLITMREHQLMLDEAPDAAVD
jgi:hypothetical protein